MGVACEQTITKLIDPMRISQKCYYALKAMLELARLPPDQPLSIAAIGQAQGIPPQFLQVIMRELRQGGFVDSRRGKEGGYLLARPARDTTLGDVIRFMEGNPSPVDLSGLADGTARATHGPFLEVWSEVTEAVNQIYDRVALSQLVDRDEALRLGSAQDFVI